VVKALVGCALSALFALPAPLADVRPHLDLARDAGRWIQASAIRTPHGLTWPADPAHPDTVATDLYSGSAGVVLFFLELHRATGDRAHLDAAAAGADGLLAALEGQTAVGLYTGLAGIGFVLAETGKATGIAKHREGARRVVALLAARATPAGDGVAWNDTTDIIDGTAGVGLFLLYAARELDLPEARALAVRAGRRLLAQGTAEAGGRKWAMTPGEPLHLPNFSHGTAGIAYFLATLYDATRERAFLDGAVAGAAYLKAVANTEGDMCLVFHHEPEAAGRSLYYLGWCHGPAGTARLWYRLWQVTGDRAWLEWTHKSARAIMASGVPERQTPGFWNNVSQCCGSAGVADFFLALHRATGDAPYLVYARRVSAQLVATATRDAAGARWIQAEHRTKPADVAAQTGWMQGAAGVGAWFLHLDAFDRGAQAGIALPDSPF
jgi:lantibiotic modifying enzyme